MQASSLSLISSLVYPSPASLREEYKEQFGSPVLPLWSFIDLEEQFDILIFTAEALSPEDFAKRYYSQIVK